MFSKVRKDLNFDFERHKQKNDKLVCKNDRTFQYIKKEKHCHTHNILL